MLYIVDISEQCGYTLAQQAALFTSIKPLFANKPVLIVCNKTDQRKMEDLDADEMDILKKLAKDALELGSSGDSSCIIFRTYPSVGSSLQPTLLRLDKELCLGSHPWAIMFCRLYDCPTFALYGSLLNASFNDCV